MAGDGKNPQQWSAENKVAVLIWGARGRLIPLPDRKKAVVLIQEEQPSFPLNLLK
ncbi:hypothetical protein [Endozoicomonas numazuensis]|uniref:hypothetical protein n=1 Tax=Endozoicomonas numazuensis TaxID=1137799 RepID=UPI000B13902C|nr:hypothetical protein [Endozoicomonas numazuensis]